MTPLTKKHQATSDKEEWSPVVGYEGLYEVSTLGRVKSLDRLVKRKNQGSYILNGRLMVGTKTKSGYTTIKLSKNSKAKTHTIHTLVMRAFVGKCPVGCEVAHLKNAKQGGSDALSNLIYCSRSCNHAFKIDDGTATIGSKHPKSKLSESQVLKIRELYLQGPMKQHEIAEKFSVSVMTINRIVNRKLWRHI